jgi:glycosyltransferase involved in cell wall biosynthesis
LFITPWNGDIAWTGKRKPLHRAIASFALKYANCITADSEHMENVCIEKYGINDKKIIRIQWSGVDIDKFKISAERRAMIRRKLAIESDDLVIISPRSISKIYNIDVVIDAFSRLSNKYPKLKLIQIWNYCDEKVLSFINNKINELGLTEKVRMVGNVDHVHVADHFAASDIYLSCSSYDTTPTTLLEAMASGCIPVISDLPAIREWIKDGVNGFIVDPLDPVSVSNGIEKALTSDRCYMSSLNELRVKAADYDENMKKLEMLYEKHAKS